MTRITVVAGVVAMVVGLAQPATATTPGADGDVAFGFEGNLWQVAAGLDPAQIPGTQGAAHPEWSPDGSTLLYVQNGLVQVRDMESGAVIAVPGIETAHSAAWSPDGSQLLVSRRVHDHLPSLWTVDLDGSNLARVARPGRCSSTGLTLPAWSPDATHIAYINKSAQTDQCKTRGPRVVLRDLTSGQRHSMAGVLSRYYDYPAVTYDADFSADGEQLVVYGSNQSEDFGAHIDITTRTVVSSAEYFCVSDSDCLDAYQPTPSGGVARVVHVNAAGGDGPQQAHLFVGDAKYGDYLDPDFFVENDETGFPWLAASHIDVQPVVP